MPIVCVCVQFKTGCDAKSARPGPTTPVPWDIAREFKDLQGAIPEKYAEVLRDYTKYTDMLHAHLSVTMLKRSAANKNALACGSSAALLQQLEADHNSATSSLATSSSGATSSLATSSSATNSATSSIVRDNIMASQLITSTTLTSTTLTAQQHLSGTAVALQHALGDMMTLRDTHLFPPTLTEAKIPWVEGDISIGDMPFFTPSLAFTGYSLMCQLGAISKTKRARLTLTRELSSMHPHLTSHLLPEGPPLLHHAGTREEETTREEHTPIRRATRATQAAALPPSVPTPAPLPLALRRSERTSRQLILE